MYDRQSDKDKLSADFDCMYLRTAPPYYTISNTNSDAKSAKITAYLKKIFIILYACNKLKGAL